MLSNLHVQNFKSILSDTIHLGQINVFIGENGAGKSNLLEALALISADKQERLDIEGLYSKGMRVAKPILTLSSFHEQKQKQHIEISVEIHKKNSRIAINSVLENDKTTDSWKNIENPKKKQIITKIEFLLKHRHENAKEESMLAELELFLEGLKQDENEAIDQSLKEYLIYNLETKALRGFSAESKKTPLGINGEGLDILLANFTESEFEQLKQYTYFINWLDDIVVDKEGSMKFYNLNPNKSTSKLYFKDKFMMRHANIFSAENANEGVLHILFYLVLFMSKKTPELFAIDNIESHLNPHLCRALITVICTLAQKNNKQALITTHNPAILDGLNLNDDNIRLFEVYRTDEGHTKTRRIQLNPDTKPEKIKLSELWMRGYLGAISDKF
ncbi:MAG: AAA family ATPase [Thiomargarita sp.]|nr:AAA family ATPase [Thiomargarita sp.]